MSRLLSAPGRPSLTILTGQGNYLLWARDLQFAAEADGCWDVVQAKIPFKQSEWQEFMPVGPSQPPGAGSAHPEPYPMDRTQQEERYAAFTEACDYWAEVKDQRDRARSLLVKSIDFSIIRGIPSLRDPHEIWTWLRDIFKMSDVLARHMFMSRIEGTNLGNFQNVKSYVDQLIAYRSSLRIAGGIYNDDMLTSKIVRGLTEKYGEFKDLYWHARMDSDPRNKGTSRDPCSLTFLVRWLLEHEAKLEARRANDSTGQSARPAGRRNRNRGRGRRKNYRDGN